MVGLAPMVNLTPKADYVFFGRDQQSLFQEQRN